VRGFSLALVAVGATSRAPIALTRRAPIALAPPVQYGCSNAAVSARHPRVRGRRGCHCSAA